MLSKHFLGMALAVAALMPAVLEGCSSSSGGNPLCCNEFQVGAQVDANIGGSAQSQVAVQAVADLGGIASAAVDDITTACMGIAQDLDAPQADQDSAAGAANKNDRMKAWCDLAVKQIGSFKAQAGGTLSVVFQPPVCEASISAKADCQAKCSGGVKCDLKANPPKCTGGTLEIECKGDCTASAGASVSCTGTCSGNCSGSCQAEGGVKCAGKCDGACDVATDSGGNCNGTCKGTCAVTAPGVQCTGTCQGKCDAACKGSATASVKCDGTCNADYQPLSCSGGKLEGGCTADAKCDANCNASVQAKASCTPPSVSVQFAGAASVDAAGKLEATLKAHLGVILAFKARLTAVADLTGTLKDNVGAVTDIKAACILPVATAVGQAFTDIGASASACGSVAGSVGG